MEVPGVDYVKTHARWTDRIVKETRVHTRGRSSGYQCRSAPTKVVGKVTNLPSPQFRQTRVAEYLSLKNASAKNQEFEFLRTLSPRSSYLIPPSSASHLGWDVAESGQPLEDAKATIPGLYNWDKSFQKRIPYSSHVRGYVTLVDVDTHPKKNPDFTLDSPHPSPGSSPSSSSGFSIPTAVVRAADSAIRRSVSEHRPFHNRSSRWFHPVKPNDISTYSQAYIRTLKSGPFDKTQILVSR